MRNSARCPKCSGTKIYVCENTQPDYESSNVILPLAVVTAPIPADDRNGKERSHRRTEWRTAAGTYETWTCAGCGFTEWYAKDPEQMLEKLAKFSRGGVRIVTAPDTAGG